jgi:hypothetical protein
MGGGGGGGSSIGAAGSGVLGSAFLSPERSLGLYHDSYGDGFGGGHGGDSHSVRSFDDVPTSPGSSILDAHYTVNVPPEVAHQRATYSGKTVFAAFLAGILLSSATGSLVIALSDFC